MTRSRVVLIFLLAIVMASPCLGQMTAVTASTSTPIQGVGHDYIKMLSETVDPASGSLSVRVQVPVPASRGFNVPFAFAYDSNGVHFLANGNLAGNGGWNTVGGNLQPGSADIASGGWSYTVPMLSYQNLTDTTGQGGPDPCSYSGTGGFVFTDASGTRHSLNLGLAAQPVPLTCPPHFEEITSANDPFYQAEIVGNKPEVVSSDGTVYTFPESGPSGGTAIDVDLPTSIEDRNGNIATVNTDTVGRSALSWSGFGSTGNTVTVSGLANPYTLTWGTANFNFTPGSTDLLSSSTVCHGIPYGQGSQAVITNISLPNGEQYTLSYDSTFGQINQITYPSGGYVSYTWGYNSLSALGIYWQSGSGGAPCEEIYSKSAVTDRYVSFDGKTIALHDHFTYATTWNGATWTTKTTTVSTTDEVRQPNVSTTTIYTYGSVPGPTVTNIPTPPGDDEIPVENSIVYRNGSGPTLRTVTKGWLNQYELICELDELDNNSISGVTCPLLSFT